jgi:DNA uptake protein ComE-like DNA-binding protein
MKPNAILAIAIFASTPAFAEPAPATAAKPANPAVAAAAAKQAAPLDINAASVEQLASVKGLNQTLAQAIVKGRPYKGTDELVKNRILTDALFAEVKDGLTVKHN